LTFQLREDFDCGKDISLGEDHCPHDVATLLKEYFRDLPEPLLCRDLYQAFVQTQSKDCPFKINRCFSKKKNNNTVMGSSVSSDGTVDKILNYSIGLPFANMMV
jgi:hypothetical protein